LRSRQWEHGDGSADTVQAYKLDENPFEKEKGGAVSPFAKVLQGVKNFFGNFDLLITQLPQAAQRCQF
jgi:hypothetical protein